VRVERLAARGRNGEMAEMTAEEGRYDNKGGRYGNRRGFARLEACSRCAIRSFLIPFFPLLVTHHML